MPVHPSALACRREDAHTSTMNDEPDSFNTPKCPRCHERLQIAGSELRPYLICLTCRLAYINQVWIS